MLPQEQTSHKTPIMLLFIISHKIVKMKHEDEKKMKNTSVAAKGALAHRLQPRTACKIRNGRQVWAL